MYSDNKVGSSSSGSTVLHPDPTGDVKRQLQKVQEQNSRLKQNFDRLQSDHRRLSAPVFQPAAALPGTHPVGRGGSGGVGGGGGGGGRDNNRDAISRKRTRDQQQQQPQHNDKSGGGPRGPRRGVAAVVHGGERGWTMLYCGSRCLAPRGLWMGHFGQVTVQWHACLLLRSRPAAAISVASATNSAQL